MAVVLWASVIAVAMSVIAAAMLVIGIAAGAVQALMYAENAPDDDFESN